MKSACVAQNGARTLLPQRCALDQLSCAAHSRFIHSFKMGNCQSYVTRLRSACCSLCATCCRCQTYSIDDAGAEVNELQPTAQPEPEPEAGAGAEPETLPQPDSLIMLPKPLQESVGNYTHFSKLIHSSARFDFTARKLCVNKGRIRNSCVCFHQGQS